MTRTSWTEPSSSMGGRAVALVPTRPVRVTVHRRDGRSPASAGDIREPARSRRGIVFSDPPDVFPDVLAAKPPW